MFLLYVLDNVCSLHGPDFSRRKRRVDYYFLIICRVHYSLALRLVTLFQLVFKQFFLHLAHVHLLLTANGPRANKPKPGDGLACCELKFPNQVKRDQRPGPAEPSHTVNENPAFLLYNFKELDHLFVRWRRTVWKL